jgi:Protein of unknown function (DUF3237)
MSYVFCVRYRSNSADQEIALSHISRRFLVVSTAAALAVHAIAGDAAETDEHGGIPMIPLRSEFLFTLTGSVAEPLEIGTTPSGERRIFPIEGGEFEGPRLKGTVLPGGSDAMLLRPDGVVLPDVRMTLRTDDAQLIFMRYGGMRHGPPGVMERLARGQPVDPAEYYFRISPQFETGSSKYSWLNRIVAVGIGHRLQTGPIYHVYEVL